VIGVIAQLILGVALLAIAYVIPSDLPKMPVAILGTVLFVLAALTWLWAERRGRGRRVVRPPPPPTQPVQTVQVGSRHVSVVGNNNTVTSVIREEDIEAVENEASVGLGNARAEPQPAETLESLLSRRPAGWEYFYFAGLLVEDRDALDPKLHDHEMRFAKLSGERVEDDDAASYLQRALEDVQGYLATFTHLFEPEVMEKAFGAPGEPGDPARIRQLAQRWTSFYEGLLDWAAKLRGASKSGTFRPLFDIEARLTDKPIHAYRAFVDLFVQRLEDSKEAIAAGGKVELQFELTLDIDDEVTKAMSAEMDRVLAEKRTGPYRELIAEGLEFRSQVAEMKVTTQAVKDITDAIRDWQNRAAERANDEDQLADLLLAAGNSVPEWGVKLANGWREQTSESLERWLSALGDL
jgi:hypothetical protein